MARGISLEELGGDRKNKVIRLKKQPEKPQLKDIFDGVDDKAKRQVKKNLLKIKDNLQPKKPINNGNIVYDDLFDQYRYNNNRQANYQNNYRINNNRYDHYNHRRRNRWHIAGRAFGFLIGLMVIFFTIVVVLSIIVGIWEFFLANEDQICCLLTLLGLLGMANQ